VAILELDFDDATALKDPSVIALTDLLAIEVAVTLQRVALLAELETIARTDELTGLPNRRACPLCQARVRQRPLLDH